MLKSGANFSDIVRIREMDAEGLSIDEISSNLLIDKEVIASHLAGVVADQSSSDDDSDEE